MGSIPESERSSVEGNGNQCQRLYLKNSTDQGACQATVRKVAKNQAGLSN